MSYQKLVRDFIPNIIKANGETPITRILNDKEFQDELIRKLAEETEEFANRPSLEELADIQEVVLALAESLGETPDALESERIRKAEKRGGFKNRIYLEGVRDV